MSHFIYFCAECCYVNVVMLNVIMLDVIMLNVTMLNVIMLNDIMLNVLILNAIMLSVIMLNVLIQNVVMLTVVAPPGDSQKWRPFAKCPSVVLPNATKLTPLALISAYLKKVDKLKNVKFTILSLSLSLSLYLYLYLFLFQWPDSYP
jgi:hypothetical protein